MNDLLRQQEMRLKIKQIDFRVILTESDHKHKSCLQCRLAVRLCLAGECEGGWLAAKQVLSLWIWGVGSHDIPIFLKQPNIHRQLGWNQLTGCYVNAFLCFHPNTIDGDRLGGPLIHLSSHNVTSDLCSGCLSRSCLL